ncbi:MAG: hypothetical protein AAF268_04050 [Cyanobacteria bacterium P01_A01_bin.3]
MTSVPSLEAPNLLMFVEAACLLQEASLQLVQDGQESIDLPKVMEDAIANAEASLSSMEGFNVDELRQIVRSVLRLSDPEDVLGLLQRLVGTAGGDIDAFLAQSSSGNGVTGMLLPRELLYGEVLRLLQTRLTPEQQQELAEGGEAAIAAEIQSTEDLVCAVARERDVDISVLQSAARQQISPLDTTDLLQLLQTLVEETASYQEAQALARDALKSKDSVTLAGPLVFTEISTHLLDDPGRNLSSDLRLDLQTNQVKATKKLEAMERLGKVENPEAQKQLIRDLIAKSSTAELLEILDTCFSPD